MPGVTQWDVASGMFYTVGNTQWSTEYTVGYTQWSYEFNGENTLFYKKKEPPKHPNLKISKERQGPHRGQWESDKMQNA
jgi:hypothetical protein